MQEILLELAEAIERGKVDVNSKYPPELVGKNGAKELTELALQNNIEVNTIVQNGLMFGMNRIGERFSQGKAFIPNLLISAKAMYAAMDILKPYFESGIANYKGTFLLGTVKGDLHDIGKNIVKMVLEGDGWNVIDLGTDVSSEKFVSAVEEYKPKYIGLSALLTTTMLYMDEIIKEVRKINKEVKIFIGGAPASNEFAEKIGADAYFSDPHTLITNLI